MAIDKLIMEKRLAHERYILNCRANGRELKKEPPPILDDALSTDDQVVITRYIEILKPLKDTIMKLEGYVGGRQGALWRLLPVYKKTLHHFEELIDRCPIKEPSLPPPVDNATAFDDSNTFTTDAISALPDTLFTTEHHFSINIKLTWQKLAEYYSKLDSNPVYVATIVLYPRFKFRWIERAWTDRPRWIKDAKTNFNTLLLEYESY